MRGVRSTVVLLVLFSALGAYIYFVELERPPASEADANELMFEVEAGDIRAMHVVHEGMATQLERGDGDTWRVTEPIETEADDAAVSSLTSGLASLEITRVVEEASSDVEPFGLAEPTLDVSFRVSNDDDEQRLLVGDPTPTGNDRYAMLAGTDRVVLVASTVESTFNKSTFDLRDKTILHIDSADAGQLEVTSGDARLHFSKDGNDWRMTEPWDVRADFSTVEGLIGRLSSGQMRSVEAEGVDVETGNIDLASFGLTEPAATTTVTTGSATATLALGGTTPGGTRYARDESRPIIFTIDASLATDLERSALDYRQKDLFAFRPFNALRVEIERTGASTVFEKIAPEGGDPTADDDSGTPAEPVWRQLQPTAEDVASERMDDLLARLSGLRAESFIDSRDAAGLNADNRVATVHVRFEQTNEEPAEEQVVFWRTSDDVYAVYGDEPGAALLSGQSFDDMLTALEDIHSADDAEPNADSPPS